MLKKSASGVLSPVSPCDVPSGYASVAPLPAAFLDGLFEHPGGYSGISPVYNIPTVLLCVNRVFPQTASPHLLQSSQLTSG